MKILTLKSENVKRLKVIEFSPEGNMVMIGGNNGAGKSSFLDSIWYGLGGKSAQCDKPIREGEDRAVITLDLGELIVKRTITEKGDKLVIEDKDGRNYKSPQSVLDKLYNRNTIDPLEFSRLKPKDQQHTLFDLVGLDFTKLDETRKEIYEKRTPINNQKKHLIRSLETHAFYPDVPEEELVISDLIQKREILSEENECFRKKEKELEDVLVEIDIAKNKIKELEQEIEGLLDRQSMLLSENQSLQYRDLTEIDNQIRTAEETNKKIRGNQSRKRIQEDYDLRVEESSRLTKQLEEIDKEKEFLLANATFPINGLSFDENGVLYQGIPFQQCSSAEKLRVSVAMGLAMNPELKVLLIRDGSLLDDESLQIIHDMAEEYDAQVWIERVGHGEECQVIIEDGEIISTASTAS